MQDKLATLKDEIVDGIKEMLMSEVVEADIKWLIGLLGGPAGAFVKACMAIYDLVMWFMDNASRLQGLIQGIISGVQALASGDVGALAKYVEDALADAVPIAIGLFASLLGIGDLSTKIRKIIDKVRQPIEDAIKYVLDLIKGFVMKIAKMLGIGGKGDGEGQIGKEVTFTAGEQKYTLDVEKSGELMLEGEDKGTLEAKLSEVAATNPKDEAQTQLSQAQTKEASASEAAKSIASKMDTVKTMDDGPILQQQQADLEADIDSLGALLKELFESIDGVAKLEDEEIGEKQSFESGEEPHTLWVESTDLPPIIMVASEKQHLANLLNSPRVKKLISRGDTQLAGDVENAKGILELSETKIKQIMDACRAGEGEQADTIDTALEADMQTLAQILQRVMHKVDDSRSPSIISQVIYEQNGEFVGNHETRSLINRLKDIAGNIIREEEGKQTIKDIRGKDKVSRKRWKLGQGAIWAPFVQDNIDNLDNLAEELIECDFLVTLDRGGTFLGKQLTERGAQLIEHHQIAKQEKRSDMSRNMISVIENLVASEPEGTKITVGVTEVSVSGSQVATILKSIVVPLTQKHDTLHFKMLVHGQTMHTEGTDDFEGGEAKIAFQMNKVTDDTVADRIQIVMDSSRYIIGEDVDAHINPDSVNSDRPVTVFYGTEEMIVVYLITPQGDTKTSDVIVDLLDGAYAGSLSGVL